LILMYVGAILNSTWSQHRIYMVPKVYYDTPSVHPKGYF
jgi:hypothetical protein